MTYWWTSLICMITVATGLTLADPSDYLNRCLDGKFHKNTPGREVGLHNKCSAYKSSSCCTNETSVKLHSQSLLYTFNYSHCGPISNKCWDFMLLDNCFYECSPNLGPWLVPDKRSWRKERFHNVPLCRSQCRAWYDACKDTMTCADDWSKGFDFSSGTHKCKAGKKCDTISSYFGNYTRFCEDVFGDFKVVDDTELCMRFDFTGPDNPNDKVAFAEAKRLSDAAGGGSVTKPQQFLVYILITGIVMIHRPF